MGRAEFFSSFFLHIFYTYIAADLLLRGPADSVVTKDHPILFPAVLIFDLNRALGSALAQLADLSDLNVEQ